MQQVHQLLTRLLYPAIVVMYHILYIFNTNFYCFPGPNQSLFNCLRTLSHGLFVNEIGLEQEKKSQKKNSIKSRTFFPRIFKVQDFYICKDLFGHKIQDFISRNFFLKVFFACYNDTMHITRFRPLSFLLLAAGAEGQLFTTQVHQYHTVDSQYQVQHF